jgi:hypothetical protein
MRTPNVASLFAASLFSTCLCPIAPAAWAQPDVGRPAPAFAATDAAGKPVELAKLRGKTVILEWTNNGCPYVGHVYRSGVMQALQKRATGQGIVWLTVISSAPGKQGYLTPPQVKAWEDQTNAAPSDVLLDPSGTLGRAYDARATPTLFIINPKGDVVYMGGIDDKPSTDPADAKTARNYVSAALDDLGAGRPVAEAVTRPYGCSVKY